MKKKLAYVYGFVFWCVLVEYTENAARKIFGVDLYDEALTHWCNVLSEKHAREENERQSVCGTEGCG